VTGEDVVVVTGAGGAIGRAVVAACAGRGYTVVATDVRASDAMFVCDVAKVADLDRLAAHLAADRRRVRGLVNVAGRPGEAALADLDEAGWDAVFAVNVRGAAMAISRLLPLMPRGASIVNFGSIASHKGVAERAAYCASKAAVIGLTRAAAVELAPRGIRVNAICPGTIDTPWIDRIVALAPDPVRAAEAMADRAPMRRTGSVTEVAAGVVFLLDDASGFITGATLPVDGGATAW
jgi:NAD(P)-dependent dehydrogenase (short-subunit alcohol dehydrogenase family)